MIVCPYCATSNDDNATVCKTCGASLDGAQYPTALRPGTLLQSGKYKLEKVLGQGGRVLSAIERRPTGFADLGVVVIGGRAVRTDDHCRPL